MIQDNERTPRAARRLWLGRSVAAAAVVGLALGTASCAQTAVPAGPPAATASPTPQASASGTPTTGPSQSPSPSAEPSQPDTSAPAKTPAKPPAPADPTAPAQKPQKPVRPSGSIRQRSTTHKIDFRKRVPLTATATFGDGVRVAVTKVSAVTAKPVGPGEVGGPALALKVRVNNGSTVPIDLSTVTVRLAGSDGVPGILSTGAPAAPMTGKLQPSAKAAGTYVFTIARKLRSPITVQVQYGAGQTVLQFSGNAQ